MLTCITATVYNEIHAQKNTVVVRLHIQLLSFLDVNITCIQWPLVYLSTTMLMKSDTMIDLNDVIKNRLFVCEMKTLRTVAL